MDPRQKVIITVARIISDYGVKGLKIDEIASELGMSKRTIYENFKDKKDIIAACVDYMVEQRMKREDEILKNSHGVVDEIFNIIDSYDTDTLINGKIAFQVMKYYPEIHAKHYERQNESVRARITDRVVRGIEEGVFLKAINVDFSVYLMMETMDVVISRASATKTMNVSVLESFKYVVIYFFRGISTSKGVQEIDRRMTKMNIL